MTAKKSHEVLHPIAWKASRKRRPSKREPAGPLAAGLVADVVVKFILDFRLHALITDIIGQSYPEPVSCR